MDTEALQYLKTLCSEPPKRCLAGSDWSGACQNLQVSRGLCPAHYAQRKNKPNEKLKPLRRYISETKDAKCRAGEAWGGSCEKKHMALGLCSGHYQQQAAGYALRELYFDSSPKGSLEKALREIVSTQPWPEVCIRWQGAPDRFGYGYLSVGGVQSSAHRWSYALAHAAGKLPDTDVIIRHLCGNGSKGCVNPRHLTSGTQVDNAQDRVRHDIEENERTLDIELQHAPFKAAGQQVSWVCHVEGCERTVRGRNLCSTHLRRSNLGKALSVPIQSKAASGAPLAWLQGIVDRPRSECAEFPFFCHGGYGRVAFEGRQRGAHRVAYVLRCGEIPEVTPVINHLCNNRKCCNPEHLEATTAADNIRYAVSQGRSGAQRKKNKRLLDAT